MLTRGRKRSREMPPRCPRQTPLTSQIRVTIPRTAATEKRSRSTKRMQAWPLLSEKTRRPRSAAYSRKRPISRRNFSHSSQTRNLKKTRKKRRARLSVESTRCFLRQSGGDYMTKRDKNCRSTVWPATRRDS
jgi:hypothetical protein